MFGLTALQLIAILLLTEIVALDSGGPQTQVISKPLFVGAVIGALLGDLKQGLFIGGTLQLMSMGIVGLGGASVPNYIITTIITTIVAIQSGEGYEIGLAVGLPVGMLFVNLDVLHKILNGCPYLKGFSTDSTTTFVVITSPSLTANKLGFCSLCIIFSGL